MIHYSHMPEGYVCPFCLLVKGIEDKEDKLIQSKQQDIVYKDDYVTALIATLWWPNNKAHVIIVQINILKIFSTYLLNMLHEFISWLRRYPMH
ncbi:hypothetical protein [Psychrobacillus faecigallinarum]|uniref:hypothetical protein n=1 Tax=Psychrobacillus faecigallinarum TaxID=2762235 RepID=UPI001CD88933|nr:hypothetical protein [Psychrobacillus faecigallinarum]